MRRFQQRNNRGKVEHWSDVAYMPIRITAGGAKGSYVANRGRLIKEQRVEAKQMVVFLLFFSDFQHRHWQFPFPCKDTRQLGNFNERCSHAVQERPV